MTVPSSSVSHGSGPAAAIGAFASPPTLSFQVMDVAAEPYAAAPSLRFAVAIGAEPGRRVRSLLLSSQVRIGVARRGYDAAEQKRLVELFGTPDRWGETLRAFMWAQSTDVVPPFEQQTLVHILVPCTYDFDVAAVKYLDGLAGGEVPLALLFSGSVFYDDASGRLQTARLSWESEAEYRMPVQVWKDLMQHYFPDSPWLRLKRDAFDRLYAYKTAHGLTSWDAAVERLLASADHSPAAR